MNDRHDQTVLRFLAAPNDRGYSGGVDAGTVLGWIDKAGYALAAQWSKRYSVTAFVGNVQFSRPVAVGSLIEVSARLVYTGRSSMHILVSVTTQDPRGGAPEEATSCLIIFVAMSDEGRPVAVQEWRPSGPDEEFLRQGAIERIAIRSEVEQSMKELRYPAEGDATRSLLRFMAAPTDVNWGGKVHGGVVMRWIDEAAHLVATRWSGSEHNAAVYSGGIRFYGPIRIGDVVEVDARLLHTGVSSMHISVHVRSGPPTQPELNITTHCLTVFVALDADGQAAAVPAWQPLDQDEVALERHALQLQSLRQDRGLAMRNPNV